MSLSPSYQKFKDQIAAVLDSGRIITNPLQTLAYGTDASFYRLIPKMVLLVHSEAEVVAIIKAANALNIALTFRAAGKVGGQAVLGRQDF